MADEVDALLRVYETVLFAPALEPKDAFMTLRRVMEALEVADQQFGSQTELVEHVRHRMRIIASLRDKVDDVLKTDASNHAWMELYERTRRVHQVLHHGMQVHAYMQQVQDSCEAGVAPDGYIPRELQSCMEDCDDMNRYQKLLLFLLGVCRQRGYARHGNMVYERIRDRRSGKLTTAWKQVCSIIDFVHSSVDRDACFDQWLNMTSSPGNASNAASFLEHCDDRQLPVLRKNRHLFAFADGLYVSSEDAFFPHDRIPERYRNCGTAKYFDTDFPFEERGSTFTVLPNNAIDTPVMQSILDYQGFDEDVCFWMYAMMGRLLYEVGEKDNFQVLPFFMGMASSGKSTLLIHVCANFFESCDVGVLSNNSERTFGLSGFVDKFLFIAPEVNENFKLDQAEFQSVVAGDKMQIAQKHVTSKTVSWKVPGILAGNQSPGWRDTAGSILRRIVPFRFRRTVTEIDTKLPEKLKVEAPACLVKCNKAYLFCCDFTGSGNLWKKLPEYFKEASRELHECINPLFAFLNSKSLDVGEDKYMPWDDFLGKFREYCISNNIPFKGLTKRQEDTTKSNLEKFNCARSEREYRFYPRLSTNPADRKRKVWLLGADAADEYE
jgi:phage/plasmid-associated DNA primase